MLSNLLIYKDFLKLKVLKVLKLLNQRSGDPIDTRPKNRRQNFQ